MKYAYPAIFSQEDGGYSIRFPDFEHCYTSAETLAEGVEMAADVLCLTLYDMEERQEQPPKASAVNAIKPEDGDFVTLVACDTVAYRKFYDNRAVKKTLTIPSWLNALAERQGVNFSATLQRALKHELNL